MFKWLWKLLTRREKRIYRVLSPMDGEVVPYTPSRAPAFGVRSRSRGIAIRPTGTRVVSPVDGEILQMFDTGQAFRVLSNDGVEVLVHVGLDTAKLNGAHYTIHAHTGSRVKAGDVVIRFDPDGIRDAGYDTLSPVIVCNAGEFVKLDAALGETVREGDELLTLGI